MRFKILTVFAVACLVLAVGTSYADQFNPGGYNGIVETGLTAVLDGTMCLEGATVDDFEACFAATDPTTPDKTITFQNVTGTVYVSSGTDVALIDGGTNASLTAVNGGVCYSSATALALSAAGTSGDILQSAGAGTPTWTATPTLDSIALDVAGVFVGDDIPIEFGNTGAAPDCLFEFDTSPVTDALLLACGSVNLLNATSSSLVINEDSADVDFRVGGPVRTSRRRSGECRHRL